MPIPKLCHLKPTHPPAGFETCFIMERTGEVVVKFRDATPYVNAAVATTLSEPERQGYRALLEQFAAFDRFHPSTPLRRVK